MELVGWLFTESVNSVLIMVTNSALCARQMGYDIALRHNIFLIYLYLTLQIFAFCSEYSLLKGFRMTIRLNNQHFPLSGWSLQRSVFSVREELNF
jgi:hypothetical protein